MKRGLIVAVGVVFSLFLLVSPAILMAQEEKAPEAAPAELAASPAEGEAAPAPAAMEEDVDYSFGTVTKVGANELTVSEYDYDTDAEVEVAYQVAPDVKLTNAANLAEITAGKSVDLTFKMQDGKKVATEISVEEPLEEDEAFTETT